MHPQPPGNAARPVILFKSPALSVQQVPEAGGHPGTPGTLLLVSGGTIPLEAGAAELLIGYLKVARAYFTPFPGSRKFIAGFYAELAGQLEASLHGSGRRAAAHQDIAGLIQQLGCISDWQQQYPPAG